MITKIETTEGVKAFTKQLIAEGISFHPDDDFNDCVNFKEDKPNYTKEEADVRKDLMSECFEACEKEGVDIYDLMLEVSLIETGMYKFIPLLSHPYPENN